MSTSHARRLRAAFVAATAAALTASTLTAAAHARPAASGRTVHVDCGSTASGQPDGSSRRPWRTLAQVNALELTPGTTVAFRRGSRCVGTLAPQGSGAAGSPVTFTAYDKGARPVIDGAGAPDTILIRNMEWVTLESLEVTNATAPGSNRRGVSFALENHGAGRGYVVRDMYVHDVWGDDRKDVNGSGGILFRVFGTERPSWFEGVHVLDNRVEHVDRTGINVSSSVWYHRAGVGISNPTHPWTPSKDVHVTGNTVTDVGGDGIVLTNVDGGTVEHNRVHGFQLRSAGYNAGIWPWNSDNTAFRYNEASGGQTTRDGMGFDIDEGTNNTLFEHNYSHDNAGGFALICTATGTITGAVFRYNISQNDHHRGVELCSGSISDAKVHNNSIYIGDGISQTVINENTTSPHRIWFDNNVVVKEGAGSATFNLRPGTQISLSHNVLRNVWGAPANPGGSTEDPRFVARGAGPDGYRLHETSPVLGTGKMIAGNGGRDYFGNAVPASGPVNPGAYEGSGVRGPAPAPVEQLPPPPVRVTNGGFESGSLSGWSSRGATVVPEAHTGSHAARLDVAPGSWATLEQSVSGLQLGVTYRLTAWIRSDGGPTVLGAKGFGGAQVTTSVTAGEWTSASVDLTAAATTATVFCYRDAVGTGSCDDITVTALP